MDDGRNKRVMVCAQCGNEFTTLARYQKLCGDECRRVWAVAYKARLRRLEGAPVRPIGRKVRQGTCGHCGATFERVTAPRADVEFCSRACSGARRKVYEDAQARLRAWRLVRCTRVRRAQIGRRFDPFEVFERDGWRCHICGKLTKRSLRGQKVPLAPELDHIMPLSKGGEHSLSNTACACFSCNARKGAKPYGQHSFAF
jgi:5-methylcytosine-specific restriction endonuclease McrA